MAIDINIPSQVKTFANLAAFPATGVVKTIYIATDTNKTYRWTGSAYVEISAAGSTSGLVPYIGAIQDLDLGANELFTGKLWLYDAVNNNYGSTHYSDGNYHIEDADGHKLLVIEDGFMQIHKTDTIQSNLYTSGLTVTRDHYLPDASGTIALTSDLSAYVPTTRTLTINGTTQDLSANRTFTISTGITIGTTAITSGVVGRVLFEGTGNVVQESANLFWDNTNGRLGIGTNAPSGRIHVKGSVASEIFKAESTIAALYAQFVSTDGAGEFGIYTDAFYFQPLSSLANGTRFLNGANTVIMQLAQTGNVLINTTTDAGFKLDVNGTARVSGVLTMVGNIIPSVTNTYALGVTGNRFTNLFCSGAIFGTSLRSSVISFGNESGTDYMRLFSTGNVAINTTTDAGFKLDVNGTARVQGALSSTANISASGALVSTGDVACGNKLYNNNFYVENTGATNIGSGQSNAPASAILCASSTTRGFLPPRMTTTQKNAIASPATGLMVYDTTLNKLCVFTTAWETVTSI